MNDRNHWQRIGLLVFLAALVQGWMLARNIVPAQDAVLFIQYARQLAQHSIIDTLRLNIQHPLYPMLIWGQHQALGGLIGHDGIGWVRCAQFVAAFAAVLLVIPMYLAGNRLANSDLATGAAALFSFLPFAARMGADAVGDSTYLLFLMLGFWACTEFWTTRRCGWLLAAGAAAGLAFLARPEALLLPAAFVVTLGVVQLRPLWRLPWTSAAAGVVLLIAGTLAVAAPYVLITGKLTPKLSLMLLPGGKALLSLGHAPVPSRSPTRYFSDGSIVSPPSASIVLPVVPGGALDFGLKHKPPEARSEGYACAIEQLIRELIAGLHYVFAPLVLVGLFHSPRRPANLFATVLSVVFAAMLVQFASKSGYLSSRHVITLVCLGSFVAARGGWLLAGALAKKLNGLGSLGSAHDSESSEHGGSKLQVRLAGMLLAVGCATCLPHTVASLHQSREGHVEAGRWLAENVPAGSVVLDSRGWASLYSNLPAYDFNGARLAFQDPRLAYVIVETGELADDHARGRTLRYLLSIGGEPITEFPAGRDQDESVRVYHWNPAAIAAAAGPKSPSLKAN